MIAEQRAMRLGCSLFSFSELHGHTPRSKTTTTTTSTMLSFLGLDSK